MGTYIDGKEQTAKCIEDLTEVTKQNNTLTSEQNEKLVSYTRWLLFLTIAIGGLALVQVIVIFLF